MRLPFLPRRVRLAAALTLTIALTLASALAPANNASASGEALKLLALKD